MISIEYRINKFKFNRKFDLTKLSPQDVPSRTNPMPGISDPSTFPVVDLYEKYKCYLEYLKDKENEKNIKYNACLLAFVFLAFYRNYSSRMIYSRYRWQFSTLLTL